MTWVFVLRKPPRMLSRHNPGIASEFEFGSLSHSSPARFNDDPIAFFDAFFCSHIRMNLNGRVFMKLSEPGDLSIFCVKESRLSRSRDQNIGIFLIEVLCAHRTFRGFPVLREWIISHLFECGGVELKLSRGSGEPSLFILVILHLSSDVIHLLKIIPGDVHRMEDIIEGLLKVVP